MLHFSLNIAIVIYLGIEEAIFLLRSNLRSDLRSGYNTRRYTNTCRSVIHAILEIDAKQREDSWVEDLLDFLTEEVERGTLDLTEREIDARIYLLTTAQKILGTQTTTDGKAVAGAALGVE